MKIRVRNFQSLDDVSIDVEGFTVLTGKSNIGKSALTRAITGAIFGIPGDAYVQRGSNTTRVSLSDPEFGLIWRKVKVKRASEETALQIMQAGETSFYTKLGREHSKLTAPLKLLEIKVSSGKVFRPQFAAQHDPIFL